MPTPLRVEASHSATASCDYGAQVGEYANLSYPLCASTNLRPLAQLIK